MSCDVTERYTPPALSQTSRGQRGKRDRLGTRLPRGKINVLNRSKMEALLELVASGFTIVYSVSRDYICNL